MNQKIKRLPLLAASGTMSRGMFFICYSYNSRLIMLSLLESPDDKSSDSMPAKSSYSEVVETSWVGAQTKNVADELFPPDDKADSLPVVKCSRLEAAPRS